MKARSNPLFPSLPLTFEYHSLSKADSLALAAKTLKLQTPLNLLQGAYAAKRRFRIPERNKKAWRLALYAFLLWFSIILAGKFGDLFILTAERHHYHSRIASLFYKQFPKAAIVTNPVEQMEAKLKLAQASSDKNRLFQWLGTLTKVSSPVRLLTLNFQNKELSLELLAPSYASLDEFLLSLKAQGLAVKQQSTAMQGASVKAELLIEGQSA